MSSSKVLSWLLRHSIEEIGDDGYIQIDTLIKLASEKHNIILNIPQIEDWVQFDKKQRFQIENISSTGSKIRAVQGHSIKHVDCTKLYTEIIDPVELSKLKNEKIMHSTFKKNIDSILKNGLQKMDRTSIHFSTDKTKLRNGNLILLLDLEKWLSDGNSIYKSNNGYIMILETIKKEYLIIK
jgi:RNA:NAD 2'-phosphotransferase (TPT1/KptA family)